MYITIIRLIDSVVLLIICLAVSENTKFHINLMFAVAFGVPFFLAKTKHL